MRNFYLGLIGVVLGLTVIMVKSHITDNRELMIVSDQALTILERNHSEMIHDRLIADEEEYQASLKEDFPDEEIVKSVAKDCLEALNCYKLAEALYHEDRSGGFTGMAAVANVIMNRVESPKFPGTIKGVVDQKRPNKNGVIVCQFSYVCLKSSLSMKNQEWRLKAGYVASLALKGELDDRTNGADHYYNPALVSRTPRFAKVYEYVASISDHEFFKSKPIK